MTSFGRVADRTHGDDDLCSFRIAVIIERFVICSYLGVHFVHVLSDDVGSSQISRIAGFPVLEKGLGLFGRSHAVRMVRVESSVLESPYCVPVDHALKFIVIPHFYLLVLMGSSESVEEMKHRQSSRYSSKMSYCC